MCHVLQSCPATHWSRIERHNFIMRCVLELARKRGYFIEVEPYIAQTDGARRKPDLLCVKNENVVVCNVGVSWKSTLLTTAYDNKVEYYGQPVDSIRQKYGENKSILIASFILSARGIWCQLNSSVTTALGLAAHDQRNFVTDVLRGDWAIHAVFNRRTWSRAKQTTHKRTNPVH